MVDLRRLLPLLSPATGLPGARGSEWEVLEQRHSPSLFTVSC